MRPILVILAAVLALSGAVAVAKGPPPCRGSHMELELLECVPYDDRCDLCTYVDTCSGELVERLECRVVIPYP